MKLHIKKGDKVQVITGKDKGKSGTIVRAFPKTGKVVVDGVAVAKRSVKGRAGEVGRIVERPMPIDASNVKKA
jgi:large subunit ribosomal protein L24